MALKDKISDILDSYRNFTIATICSHSSLQIFMAHGRKGIKTIGIVRKDRKTLYESFPYGKPDEFIVVDDYSKFL